MKRKTGSAVALALAVLLSGCGSGDKPEATQALNQTGPTRVTAVPTPVPKPVGKPVLKLSGALTNHNSGKDLVLDQKQLEAMPAETATVYEPWVKKRIEFTGVPVSLLLTTAGISPSATEVKVHAIDDYQVEFKIADLMAPGVLLATRQEGEGIPIADGGPVRLVFPPDSVTGRNRDTWVWSIDSFTVS
jgi:hypothetical protein